jgi:heme A synthase
MTQTVPITSFLVKYAVVLAATIISAAFFFLIGYWITHSKEMPYPSHFTRSEQYQEFDLFRRSREHEKLETFGCALVVLFFLALAVFYAVRDRLSAMTPASQRVLCGIAFIVTVATILFLLKIKTPRCYAALEIAFALTYSGVALYKLKDQIELIDVTVLGSATYLVIRGLDNYRKGQGEANKKADSAPKEVHNIADPSGPTP